MNTKSKIMYLSMSYNTKSTKSPMKYSFQKHLIWSQTYTLDFQFKGNANKGNKSKDIERWKIGVKGLRFFIKSHHGGKKSDGDAGKDLLD